MNLPRSNTTSAMNSSSAHSVAAVTIYAVALPPQTTIPVLDAAEVAGFGFRQYPTVESLLDSAAPSCVGCLLISCTSDSVRNASTVERLKSHFHSIPVIVLLDSDSAERAVELMQQGVFSVLPRPFEHQRLLSTINAAVDFSVRSQSAIDTCRESSLRMHEATVKEREVLQLIMAGRKNKEIASALGITVRAVEDRRFRLMKKVRVDSVAELVALAVTAKYYEQGFTSSGTQRNPIPNDIRQSVKGIEVWVPNDDDSHLKLDQSCYRDAAAFQDASRGLTFYRGEGLPGKVWERQAPAFLNELITTDFVRSREAGAAGMTTAVGFPIFSRERVQAVVLILLDSRHQMKAAFESWRLDPQTSTMRLAGGTYINCEKVRRLTEFLHLPVGEGLPGVAAEQGRPYPGSRFDDDGNAVRGLALAAEQLVSGIALPLTDSGAVTSDVFMLFNSDTTPMFSLIQVWKPTADGCRIALTSEYADGVPSLSSQMAKLPSSVDRSIAGRCWTDGSPVIVDNGSAEDILRSATIPAPAFGIAIPTLINGKVVAVTVLAN